MIFQREDSIYKFKVPAVDLSPSMVVNHSSPKRSIMTLYPIKSAWLPSSNMNNTSEPKSQSHHSMEFASMYMPRSNDRGWESRFDDNKLDWWFLAINFSPSVVINHNSPERTLYTSNDDKCMERSIAGSIAYYRTMKITYFKVPIAKIKFHDDFKHQEIGKDQFEA